MNKFVVSIIGLEIILSLSAVAQAVDSTQTGGEPHAMFDPRRDAEKDLQEAIVRARHDRKMILLDVGGEWCIWCHRLDSVFTMNPDLAEYLRRHYVVVKINVSKENRNTEFLAKYPNIEGYPHIFVLDENGELLCSQDTGEFEYPEGYPRKGHDKQKIFIFLKRWAEQ